jgi:hypothetical protein
VGDAQRLHGAAVLLETADEIEQASYGFRMAGMDVHVSEDDVRRYVAETLRRDKRSDWDIDAITRDVIAEWPDLVGAHPDLVDMPGPDYVAGWLDRAIQPESRYWDIFARHRVRRLAE